MSDDPQQPKETENKPAIMGAIENGDEEQEQEVVVLPNQPRQPRDMKGLMRFAMEATAMEDAPSSSNFQPMAEEKKKFLSEALQAMSVDLVEVLMKALDKLRKVHELKTGDDPEELEEALETVSDTVENADFANDFHKIGGFDILLPCLTCSHSSLQWRTADLIAQLTQNNPYCQSNILAAGLLPILLGLVDGGCSEKVKVKALYAVSCLVRDFSEGLEKFIELDGFSVLLRAMQSDYEKLKTKSAFLLSALCSNHPELRDDLQKMGWVQQLVGLIGGERTTAHEHLLSGLLALIRDHHQCIKDCRDPNLQLKTMLSDHLDYVKGKEEFLEEEEYIQEIISIVFSDDSTGGDR